MEDLIFTIQANPSEKVCESEIGTNAIESRIYFKPRHHLAAFVIRLFQTPEDQILIAKREIDGRSAVRRNVPLF